MKPIHVAAVSMENYIGRPSAAIESMRYWVTRATQQGAELVLFPELNVTGYLCASGVRDFAEPVPGTSTEAIAQLAGETRVVIGCGILERADDRLYCTHVLIDGSGVIGRQRKIHVPVQERPFWDAGSSIDVFTVRATRVGITVCRDSFFDEMTRTLYFKGAEIVLMPFSYYNVPRERYLRETIHGMSIVKACWTNGYFGVACNSAGTREPSRLEPSGARFPGWAGIVGPWGDVMASVEDPGNDAAMVVVDLDPAALESRRSHPNFLAAELRPELYELGSIPPHGERARTALSRVRIRNESGP